MPEDTFDSSELFTELSEYEQSLISGGISAVENKLHVPKIENDFAEKYTTVTNYDSSQFTIHEKLAIPEYGNYYLSGSSTLSVSADTASQASIILSENSAIKISSDAKIFNLLPTESKQTITQLLDTNADNRLGLSMTHYTANIKGEETVNIANSFGSIKTTNTWTLDVNTAALGSVFSSQKPSNHKLSSVISQSDISNLIPQKNQQPIAQFLGTNNLNTLGLGLTYYSANYQSQQTIEINGLAAKGIITSENSLNIETSGLSGILISSSRKNDSLSEVNNTDMVFLDQDLVQETNSSLLFGETSGFDINTASGILGSTINLSSILGRIEFEDFSESLFFENKFLDNEINDIVDFESLTPAGGLQFGFSSTNFDLETSSRQAYDFSGDINSLETVVDSILGMNLPNTGNIESQTISSSQLQADSLAPLNPMNVETSLGKDINIQFEEIKTLKLNDVGYLSTDSLNFPNLETSENFIADSFNFASNISLINPQTSQTPIPHQENIILPQITAYPLTNYKTVYLPPVSESNFNTISTITNLNFFTSEIPNFSNKNTNPFPVTSNLPVLPTNSNTYDISHIPANFVNMIPQGYLTLITNRRKEFLLQMDKIPTSTLSRKPTESRQKKPQKN
ncbi:MAG: hypothetical protein KI793_07400 [Rivularia sp. (in: Bacteria)]|nr:hypothetical protein [Rivularia sp. MS3]